MKPFTRSIVPKSLAARFALAAAGLAAAALLLTSLASWRLINEHQEEALSALSAHERQFHAEAVGSQLRALAERMSEVARSTVLATGLVDSVGRQTYLVPFLAGIRQVNGVPVQVMFADFEGTEIATNGIAYFTLTELEWLREQLKVGRARSDIFPAGDGYSLVAFEPLTYSQTASPDGALLYKVPLDRLHAAEGMALEWGPLNALTSAEQGGFLAVAAPPVFEPLHFRVRGPQLAAASNVVQAPQYVAIFMVGLILFAAVVVAGFMIARLLTRDVYRLEAFSTRVIRSGLSAERARVEGSAEVASLAASINRMLDRLQEQQSDLVHERERLSELAEALKRADERKDEFLAILAHELRNPLAPIASSLEIMKRASGDAALGTRARGTIERQVRHLVRLVDDLLDVSRITRGRLELRKEQVDLSSLIDQAVESCRGQIDAGGQTLTVSRPDAPVLLEVDPARVVQVLSNLLNNAARYTERGGRIALEAVPADGHVDITVRDTGVGIAPDMIELVFDMFTRANQPSAYSTGGLGIGLTLARRLVELHGGTLTARSEGVGRGSELTMRLPVASDGRMPISRGESGAPDMPAGRVLVVDDNRDAAASLAKLLEVTGSETRIVYDGAEAVAAAAAYRPDVILLDIGLPKMNGYEACRAIRETREGGSVFIVALTGWGQEQDRARSREAGFDAHLVKPADYATLARLLAQRRAEVRARTQG